MPTDPIIPHGYRQLAPGTLTQKGDGRWTATRYLKVKPEMPAVREGEIVIRKCEVVQAEISGVVPAENGGLCLDE